MEHSKDLNRQKVNYLKRNSIESNGYELSVLGQAELAKKSKDQKNALVGEYLQIIQFAPFRLIHPEYGPAEIMVNKSDGQQQSGTSAAIKSR